MCIKHIDIVIKINSWQFLLIANLAPKKYFKNYSKNN